MQISFSSSKWCFWVQRIPAQLILLGSVYKEIVTPTADNADLNIINYFFNCCLLVWFWTSDEVEDLEFPWLTPPFEPNLYIGRMWVVHI